MVRLARRSEVRKRRPYPVSGLPASSEKTLTGTSALAPVCGTAARCHLTGCAPAATGKPASARAAKQQQILMIGIFQQTTRRLYQPRTGRDVPCALWAA